jgi:hypothetical protein
MPKLIELIEKRNKVLAAARAFLESKRGDNDTLSAEDDATYNKMEADIMALGREIERENRLSALDRNWRSLRASLSPTSPPPAPLWRRSRPAGPPPHTRPT